MIRNLLNGSANFIDPNSDYIKPALASCKDQLLISFPPTDKLKQFWCL